MKPLKLHEFSTISNDMVVFRVHGGHIYYLYNTDMSEVMAATFVPDPLFGE